MISKRKSDISCDKEWFDKAAPDYNNNSLKNSDFNENMKFTPQSSKTRKHGINAVFFDPPFNSKVITNIGKIFLRVLEKHFPKHNKYCKLFNRKKVKISYSCVQNMPNFIQNHNTVLLKSSVASTAKECSYRQKYNCSQAEKCLSECLAYHAEIDRSDRNQTKNRYGFREKNFKECYNNHTTSFRNKSKEKSTEVSKYIWELENSCIKYDLKWPIVCKTDPHTARTRKCIVLYCKLI